MDRAIIEELHCRLADAASTLSAGARLAAGLRGGMVVTLSGELGAGKTTLVRGMLQTLGWKGTVKSPSYTLVEHYFASSIYFYHFDFYRFADPDEWQHTGFAEYFRPDAICVIEWPEKIRQPMITEMLGRATSNQGYHHFGEGRFFILAGRGFAETMVELLKN